jgi:trehalose 6-phosphate synthase
MNLVAKEYVASRNDLDGALVLSEFSGAAAELTSAFLVNTYDRDRVKDAMYNAITVDPHERRRRMRALRRQVLTHDSDRWTRSFLAALDPAAATPR